MEEGAGDEPAPAAAMPQALAGSIRHFSERQIVAAVENAGVMEFVAAQQGTCRAGRAVGEQPGLTIAEMQPAAVTTKRDRTRSPASVVTAQQPALSSKRIAVTAVPNRKLRRRSKRSATWPR